MKVGKCQKLIQESITSHILITLANKSKIKFSEENKIKFNMRVHL
jgi:hypothetical protein